MIRYYRSADAKSTPRLIRDGWSVRGGATLVLTLATVNVAAAIPWIQRWDKGYAQVCCWKWRQPAYWSHQSAEKLFLIAGGLTMGQPQRYRWWWRWWWNCCIRGGSQHQEDLIRRRFVPCGFKWWCACFVGGNPWMFNVVVKTPYGCWEMETHRLYDGFQPYSSGKTQTQVQRMGAARSACRYAGKVAGWSS